MILLGKPKPNFLRTPGQLMIVSFLPLKVAVSLKIQPPLVALGLPLVARRNEKGLYLQPTTFANFVAVKSTLNTI